MTGEYILILTLGSCISFMICCVCIRYCKDKEREIEEKTNLKKFHEGIKRKNIIKSVNETVEFLYEEVNDEKANNFRTTEIITNEHNV